MIKAFRKTVAVLLAITMSLVFPGHCFAADKSPEKEIKDIFAARFEQSGVKTAQELVWMLSDTPESGDEWYIISLRQALPGQLDFSEYRKAYEEYVRKTDIKNATAKLKAALTLQAVGSSSPFIGKAADEGTGEGGVMSWIYGLHVLNNGAVSSGHSTDSVIAELLKLQLADGGWAVMGDNGDVDVTAMAVQALAPHRDREDVKNAVDRAIDLLSLRQKDNGYFSSFGDDNAESTAQVLVALSSAGIDCAEDERFIKNGKTIPDILDSFKVSAGKYSHDLGGEANASATLQTLYSLISYKMFLDDGGKFFVFGEYSEPSVPRPYVPGPEGNTDPGSTVDPDGGSALPAKSIKPYLYAAVAAAAVIACIALVLLKKRSYKSYLFVVLLAAIAAVCVTFINVERPSDYYGRSDEIKDPVKTGIIIDAHTIAGENSTIPADGIILGRTEVVIDKGQTAYDQLISAVKANSIHIEVSGSSYVAGIANIYELQYGDLSGWMYRVNGGFASVGCGEYVLSEGDLVEWLYTKNIGKDIGSDYMGK